MGISNVKDLHPENVSSSRPNYPLLLYYRPGTKGVEAYSGTAVVVVLEIHVLYKTSSYVQI